ncbi:MAG: hypothetical protein RLY86_796 [Pseudomonadota bacterium]|jgi:nitroreductase
MSLLDPLRDPARDPWTIDAADFPSGGCLRDRARFALRYAVLAPSGHNTQPWRFILTARGLELRADRTRALPVVDPEDRALTISCGAALGHLDVALSRFGIAHRITPLPDAADPDLLARVTMADVPIGADLDSERLCAAIPRRRTNRRSYDSRPPAGCDLIACTAAAEQEGARLHVLTHPRELDAIAALVAEGDRQQFQDPAFRRELARWVRSHHGPGHDGLSGAAFGMPDMLSVAGAAAIRLVDMGARVGAKDLKLTAAGPALGVLTTRDDTPEDWIIAGRALSRVLLTLTDRDLSAAFLNEPIEVPALRPQLRGLLPGDGIPQMMFRIGYAAPIPPAARRPREEVLTER